MLRFLKHTILWVIALSILNTSIDIPEHRLNLVNAADHPADQYDEIESIAEFLLDEALDQTLPDQSGNDEQGLLKKTVTFDFSIPEKKEKLPSLHFRVNNQQFSARQDQHDLPAGFLSIFTPPPDQA